MKTLTNKKVNIPKIVIIIASPSEQVMEEIKELEKKGYKKCIIAPVSYKKVELSFAEGYKKAVNGFHSRLDGLMRNRDNIVVFGPLCTDRAVWAIEQKAIDLHYAFDYKHVGGRPIPGYNGIPDTLLEQIAEQVEKIRKTFK